MSQKEGFSFPKGERILKPDDFSRVRKTGKRVSTRSLTVYMLPTEAGVRRLGLSVSSRVGNSVVRNRVKRLLREAFRLNKGSFPGSSDILVSVKSAAWIKDLNDCKQELSKIFVTP
jgi:ribonuclease P protein component